MVDSATQVFGLMNALRKRTEPSPNATLQPGAACSAYISSVWPNGLLGAWMMTCGWSWTSGPLWTPTRQPLALQSEGQGLRSRRGQVAAPGTTPTHVLWLRNELCSPRTTVLDNPSDTSATGALESL